MRMRRAIVATPREWQCKTGGVRRLAVANGTNIFQMLLVREARKFVSRFESGDVYKYFTVRVSCATAMVVHGRIG